LHLFLYLDGDNINKMAREIKRTRFGDGPNDILVIEIDTGDEGGAKEVEPSSSAHCLAIKYLHESMNTVYPDSYVKYRVALYDAANLAHKNRVGSSNVKEGRTVGYVKPYEGINPEILLLNPSVVSYTFSVLERCRKDPKRSLNGQSYIKLENLVRSTLEKRRRLEAQDLETGLIETVYSPFISNVPDDFKIEAAVLDYLINQGVPPTFVPVEYEMPISQLYNSVPKNHPKVSKDFQAGILTALNLVSTQLASFVKTLSPDAKNATAIKKSQFFSAIMDLNKGKSLIPDSCMHQLLEVYDRFTGAKIFDDGSKPPMFYLNRPGNHFLTSLTIRMIIKELEKKEFIVVG